jgi:hypothetical protein
MYICTYCFVVCTTQFHNGVKYDYELHFHVHYHITLIVVIRIKLLSHHVVDFKMAVIVGRRLFG